MNSYQYFYLFDSKQVKNVPNTKTKKEDDPQITQYF